MPRPDGDFADLAAPARRALAGARLQRLEDLTRFTDAEIAALHGMGPRAMDRLRARLAGKGLAFRA